MAQLNSRGTQTRNRWDYFEHSNGISLVFGSTALAYLGAYFANNSPGATAIDVYTLNWATNGTGLFELVLLLPPLVLTPLTPTESHIFPLQPDTAAPPGINGMFTANTSTLLTMVRYSGGSAGAQVAPIMGTYFVTLPPGWGIGILGQGLTTPTEISLTVWYQYVLDNIAPAK